MDCFPRHAGGDRFIIAKGETIRFEIKNTGKIKHELVLGTLQELKGKIIVK